MTAIILFLLGSFFLMVFAGLVAAAASIAGRKNYKGGNPFAAKLLVRCENCKQERHVPFDTLRLQHCHKCGGCMYQVDERDA